MARYIIISIKINIIVDIIVEGEGKGEREGREGRRGKEGDEEGSLLLLSHEVEVVLEGIVVDRSAVEVVDSVEGYVG